MRLQPTTLGPGFTRLWAANATSGLGDGIALAAGPLLLASLTGDPRLIAGAAAVQQLPSLVLALHVGVLIDRLDKRRVALACDVLRALTTGVTALLVASGHATVPAIYALLLLEGVGSLADRSCGSAMLPVLVGSADLPRANSRLFGANLVAFLLIGPPIGAALFVADAWVPFAVDAATFALSFALVAAIDWREAPREGPAGTIRAGARAAAAWLWHTPALRTLALSICVMNVTFGGVMAVLVIYVTRRLDAGAGGYGALLTATAIGGVAGASLATRLERRFGSRWLLRVGLAVEALTHVGLALSTSLVWAYAVMLAFGVHALVWDVVTQTARQRLTPLGMQASAAGAYAAFSVGGHAVGAVLGGVLVSAFGILAPFWVAAVGVGALLVVAWRPFGQVAAGEPARQGT